MNSNDVIDFMEQNCGLNEGYEKNPVALKRMAIIMDELKKVGITKITKKNKEQVQYVTNKYVSNGHFSYSKGDNGGMIDSHYCTEHYVGYINEDGSYVETNTRINKILLDSHPTRQEESRRTYNKHGLEIKREEKFKETSKTSSIEERYEITRDDEMVTSTITGSRKIDGKDCGDITQKVLLLDEDLSPKTTMDYDVSYMKGYYDEMESQREDLNEGRVLSGTLLAIDDKKVELPNEFYSIKSNFDYNCMVSPEFRESAKEKGLYMEPVTKINNGKMKAIYENVSHKISEVADKFDKKVKGEQTQTKDIM